MEVLRKIRDTKKSDEDCPCKPDEYVKDVVENTSAKNGYHGSQDSMDGLTTRDGDIPEDFVQLSYSEFT